MRCNTTHGVNTIDESFLKMTQNILVEQIILICIKSFDIVLARLKNLGFNEAANILAKQMDKY